MKVSIVMSAYNAEDTIVKAVSSCLNQTYKNIELIVVDDCSTDNTGYISVIEKDPRFVYTLHSENKGAGWARNTGVKMATGDYISFVDSDDWIDKDFIETLINRAIETNADIVTSGLRIIENDKTIDVLQGKDNTITDYKFTLDNANIEVFRFLNHSLFKRDLFRDFEYNTRRFIEDSPTLIYLCYNAKIKSHIAYVGYNYVQNPKSLCHEATKDKFKIYRVLAAIDVENFFLERNIDLEGRLFFAKYKEMLGQSLTDDSKEKFKDEIVEIFDYLLTKIKINNSKS